MMEDGAASDDGVFDLVDVTYGAFSTPTAQEALAKMSGCESHGEEWGGAVLLKRVGNGWDKLGYFPGLVFEMDDCLNFRTKKGAVVLVCKVVHSNGGMYESIVSIRFSDVGLIKDVVLRGIDSNMGDVDPCTRMVTSESVGIQKAPDSPESAFVVSINAEKSTPIPGKACDWSSRDELPLVNSKRGFRMRYLVGDDDVSLDPSSKAELDAFTSFSKP